MKVAILIVDVLQDFFQKGHLKECKKTLTNNINELTKFGRLKNIPIIWVRQEFEADLSDAFTAYRKNNIRITIKNTLGSQLLPELKTDVKDHKIIKKRYSAFYNTSLDDFLKKLKIDIVIIAGVNTHACVRMAVIDAYQRDYDVILAIDCVDSYDKEHHKISLKYLGKSISTLMTNREIMQKIQ